MKVVELDQHTARFSEDDTCLHDEAEVSAVVIKLPAWQACTCLGRLAYRSFQVYQELQRELQNMIMQSAMLFPFRACKIKSM
jgi:hypothetical protein